MAAAIAAGRRFLPRGYADFAYQLLIWFGFLAAYQVARGLADRDPTRAFTNGWFRTGDLGVIDAAGYVTLQGRIKELINRGGEKISPREVDEVLLQHPSVAEAVSFGAPHPVWGEEVAVAVVLRAPATEAELQRHCREHLADFKVPQFIAMRGEPLPRNPGGKVLKAELREHTDWGSPLR